MNISIENGVRLVNYTFSWNDTGSWANDTGFQIGDVTTWNANTSKQITASLNTVVSWRYYTRDNSSNYADSGLYNFTVVNNLPTHSTPILNSTLGTNLTSENLTVYNQSTADADNDAVTNIIDWRLNGSSFAVLNMPFDTNDTGKAGNPIRDYSLNVNNLSLQGGILWNASGKRGGAYDFDGSNDYLYNGGVANFRGSDNTGTITSWVKTTAAEEAIFVSSDEATDSFYIRTYVNTGKISIQVSVGNILVRGDTPIDDGKWHFVVVTSDGSAYTLYADGVLQTLTVVAGSNNGAWFNDVANRDNIAVGAMIRNTGNPNNPYSGLIDDVRIYDKALTLKEIQ